jgi:hypothetical protein
MISAKVRKQVRAIYVFQCGYCGLSETDSGNELTIDHYKPLSWGGEDVLANLVYACFACNTFKGDYWSEEEGQKILHPLHDDLAIHFVAQDDGTLRPLSERGQFFIDRLHLNRPAMVRHRLLLLSEQQRHAESREIRRLIENIDSRLRPLEERRISKKRNKD